MAWHTHLDRDCARVASNIKHALAREPAAMTSVTCIATTATTKEAQPIIEMRIIRGHRAQATAGRRLSTTRTVLLLWHGVLVAVAVVVGVIAICCFSGRAPAVTARCCTHVVTAFALTARCCTPVVFGGRRHGDESMCVDEEARCVHKCSMQPFNAGSRHD